MAGTTEQVHKHKHLNVILKLPLADRLFHRLARRHVLAVLLGILTMLVGSAFSSLAHHQALVPVAVWDATGYFIHGVGAVPILRHIEPFWIILVGMEKVEGDEG